jgi:hypothetical protein
MKVKSMKWNASCFLLIYLLFSSFTSLVYSKPVWLETGVYIEYKIVDAEAASIVLNVPIDLLESFGLLHKYKVGNFTIYIDLDPNEFEEWLKRQNPTGFTGVLGEGFFIISLQAFYIRLSELSESGQLPSHIPEKVSTYQLLFSKYRIYNASYSWSVIGFTDSLAEVKVRFNGLVGEYAGTETISLVDKYIDQTFIILVNPDTREVFTQDGKYLGVVPFWVTGLDVGRSVMILSLYNHTIGGVVGGELEVKTPLGIFQSYTIGETEKTITFPSMKFMRFDKIKGILLSTHGYSDPVLLHFMNISFIDTGSTGMVISKLELVEPPKKIIPREQVWGLLGLALIGLALLVSVFAIFRRKRLMEAQAEYNAHNGFNLAACKRALANRFFIVIGDRKPVTPIKPA